MAQFTEAVNPRLAINMVDSRMERLTAKRDGGYAKQTACAQYVRVGFGSYRLRCWCH